MTVLSILFLLTEQTARFFEFLAYQHCAMPLTLEGKATCQQITQIQILRLGYAG